MKVTEGELMAESSRLTGGTELSVGPKQHLARSKAVFFVVGEAEARVR